MPVPKAEKSDIAVLEAYYRVGLGEMLALTGDLQYMQDDRVTESSPRGFVYGMRLAVEF